jgi:hypothetical protein
MNNKLDKLDNKGTFAIIRKMNPRMSEGLYELYSMQPPNNLIFFNGLVLEQQIYTLAANAYQMSLEDRGNFTNISQKSSLLAEAESLLCEYGFSYILPQEQDYVSDWFLEYEDLFREVEEGGQSEAIEDPEMREQIAIAFRDWTADWVQIISRFDGKTFVLGQNRYRVARAVEYDMPEPFRRVAINCEVIGVVTKFDKDPMFTESIPLLQVGAIRQFATFQIEVLLFKLLGARIDIVLSR